MLKQLMLSKRKESLEFELIQQEERKLTNQERQKQLERAIDEVKTEDEMKTVESEVNDAVEEEKGITEKIDEIKGKIQEVEDEIKLIEDKMENKTNSQGGKVRMKKTNNENDVLRREAFEAYARNKELREGIVSTDIGVTIPVDLSTKPIKAIETVTDLSKFVRTVNVATASGKYPTLKRSKATLNTVAELAKNPELAKPDFNEIEWAVETFRGALPISQESIDDSDIDVISLIAECANEQKLNTYNARILSVLKTFTTKTAVSLDDLKKIKNVDLDPAYSLSFIITQSAYQMLDTIKDEKGRYILQDNVVEGSPRQLLGHRCEIVEDTALGNKGEALMFVGDLKEAVFLAARKDIAVKWQDNDVYGQVLMAGMRFNVVAADKNAGYFVTLNIPTVA